ncbi:MULTISPECIES: alpha/beta fold hydrolase [unclassified Nodularia (in: cyanobacteria)]|uniref:alpha/beta hydrolase n=1 Tax=unclassified Nodularia (in: cyanobacteria) TaxID=2656917 RepID=UPI00187F045C|nr:MULTISPECIES: alpha/beta fold hydrolase [unclassified Nodularia (in: cyanobacteria)]MBE9200366.1 alpha/beta fold hydrolase [Nodularia sp. LEGE 06071]MCC2695842.1 alpha/beta fold hydrolase [Nodularia sp. LEGE 04288]
MQLCFKLLLTVEIFVVIVYFAICLLLFVKQHQFIFFPSSVIERTPEFFNLPYEDVWLPVKLRDGQTKLIHGWWIKSPQPDADVLLYLHGNAINVSANIGHANRFHQLGFSVLLIDYRGYGRSQGYFPNEKRVYQDAAVAWNYLVQKQQIPPEKIFIYGHSMGGAIAIDLAIKQPEAAGLIVESSFTSIEDMVAYRNLFRIFPVSLLLTQRFESIKKVPQLKMPVLFIHGSADTTVPSFMSQKLYHAAPEPKKLFLVPAADHNDTAIVAGDEYVTWIRSFVQRVKQF